MNVSQTMKISLYSYFPVKKLNYENLSNKSKVPQAAKGKTGVGVERLHRTRI